VIYQELDCSFIFSLLSLPGFGRKTVQQFLDWLTFSPATLQELKDALTEAKGKISHLKIPDIEQLQQGIKAFDVTIAEAEKAQVHVIGISDPQFPEKLREISDPPLILYAKGNLDCLKPEQSIAVIGTRSPTEHGRKSGRRIAKRFAEQGLIIVSGLAEGCDTSAHEGCLDAQGLTVAVMAHGLHTVYPAKNRELADRILDSNGCWVSEYRLGQKAERGFFVERDRLQSALSSAVLIIETDIKGGTLHTAEFCLQQGRILACLNHPPKYQSDKSRGNIKLIQEKKAIPLWNPSEIDDFLKHTFNIYPRSESSDAFSETSLETPLKVDQPTPNHLLLNLLSLNQGEREQFEELCKAQGQTPDHVVKSLVRDYLKLNDQNEPSHVSKVNSGQLALSLSLEETTQKSTETAILSSSTVEESIAPILLDSDVLTQAELSNRLGVSPNTLRTKKKAADFSEWSSKKDPDRRSWQYSEQTKKFEPFF